MQELLTVALIGLLAFPGAYAASYVLNGREALEEAMVEAMQEQAREQEQAILDSIKPENRWQQ
jgi:hypothetical protein